MILDKALAQVGGELIKVLDIRPAGVGTYPTAIVVVKRDAELHPYVTWRAIDSTRDGIPAHFESGNYCETLEEALQDPRKA
jgi:hypothetical protein